MATLRFRCFSLQFDFRNDIPLPNSILADTLWVEVSISIVTRVCPPGIDRAARHDTLFVGFRSLKTMPLVPLRVVLDHAAENSYGVAAFNVNNMEQIQSIMEAARETDSPVIVQASRGARSYSRTIICVT